MQDVYSTKYISLVLLLYVNICVTKAYTFFSKKKIKAVTKFKRHTRFSSDKDDSPIEKLKTDVEASNIACPE